MSDVITAFLSPLERKQKFILNQVAWIDKDLCAFDTAKGSPHRIKLHQKTLEDLMDLHQRLCLEMSSKSNADVSKIIENEQKFRLAHTVTSEKVKTLLEVVAKRAELSNLKNDFSVLIGELEEFRMFVEENSPDSVDNIEIKLRLDRLEQDIFPKFTDTWQKISKVSNEIEMPAPTYERQKFLNNFFDVLTWFHAAKISFTTTTKKLNSNDTSKVVSISSSAAYSSTTNQPVMDAHHACSALTTPMWTTHHDPPEASREPKLTIPKELCCEAKNLESNVQFQSRPNLALVDTPQRNKIDFEYESQDRTATKLHYSEPIHKTCTEVTERVRIVELLHNPTTLLSHSNLEKTSPHSREYKHFPSQFKVHIATRNCNAKSPPDKILLLTSCENQEAERFDRCKSFALPPNPQRTIFSKIDVRFSHFTSNNNSTPQARLKSCKLRQCDAQLTLLPSEELSQLTLRKNPTISSNEINDFHKHSSKFSSFKTETCSTQLQHSNESPTRHQFRPLQTIPFWIKWNPPEDISRNNSGILLKIRMSTTFNERTVTAYNFAISICRQINPKPRRMFARFSANLMIFDHLVLSSQKLFIAQKILLLFSLP